MAETRVIIPLLKAPISNISDKGFTILLGAFSGATTSMRITANTQQLDLHDGDLVTLYTEVLLKPSEGTA